MLAMTEGAGGLFDFNATLPLMAIQFILLTVVLTFVFYKPVAKVLDDRETFISGNLTTASEKLIKADDLYKQYEEQLKSARVNAQSIVAESEKKQKMPLLTRLDKPEPMPQL
jgi:F-type H+-transporting ATPase subunit b